MKVAVVTLGSAGDLHPFLAIARELVRRGHDVHLLSQAPYESQVRAEGVRFVPIVDSAAHARTLHHPLLWHPLHGFGVLWRHLAVPSIEPTCEWIGQWSGDSAEPVTVLASPLAVGARFARERWPDRIRLMSGYTAPMGLRSIDDPMFLGAWQVPAWVPRPARHMLWRLLDRWKLEPLGRSTLSTWQQQWGIAAHGPSVFGDWIHSPDGGVTMYPQGFAAIPEAWRRRGVLEGGFPFYQAQHRPGLDPSVQAFIERHGRAVVVYPGSAAGSEHRFQQLLTNACDRLGRPCIFVGAHLKEQRAAPKAAAAEGRCLYLAEAPIAHLLPHSTHFVHHGGIGSVAHGLAAGTPQLILASAFDQFENGARVQLLGQGCWLSLRRTSARQVTESLQTMSSSAKTPASLATRDYGEPAVARICDTLERRSDRSTEPFGI